MRPKFYWGLCHCTSGLCGTSFCCCCFSVFQPFKWGWLVISLIKHVDIYNKRHWGKAVFHYLYAKYKIYYTTWYLCKNSKRSKGHEKRSNIIGDVSNIDFVFIQVERPPNVRGFFSWKGRFPLLFGTTNLGLCPSFATGIIMLYYLPYHQSLLHFQRKLSSCFFFRYALKSHAALYLAGTCVGTESHPALYAN